MAETPPVDPDVRRDPFLRIRDRSSGAGIMKVPDARGGRWFAGFAFVCAAAAAGPGAAQEGGEQSDVDRLMRQVLARGDANRIARRRYVFNEVERFAVTGPGGEAYRSFVREYVWYERDGVFVRSPVRIDGVAVGEADWRRYEASWRAAEARRAGEGSDAADESCGAAPAAESAGAGADPGSADAGRADPGSANAAGADPGSANAAGADPGSADAGGAGPGSAADLQPRFLSASYWIDFEFEPGNYYFAGRERLAGRDVLRVEYYPERLFGERSRDDTECGRAAVFAVPGAHEALNKTALVTLWIDPEEHRIVRFAFDDAGFDFLPLRWLIRLDDLSASMTMGRPLDDDVWLPERIEASGVMTMASGSATVTYSRTFTDWRRARTGGRLRGPRP